MKGPETLAERQVAKILEESRFDDDVGTTEYVNRAYEIINQSRIIADSQSYTNRLDNQLRMWRARLILPSGGVIAGLTGAAVFRLLPLEMAGPATFVSFFVGLGVGEALAIGVAHAVAKISTKRSS